MTRLADMLRDAAFRRALLMASAALAVWVIFAALLWAAGTSGNMAGSDISSSARVLDYAMQFRALPRTGGAAAAAPGEPLGALSEILDALGLRDRVRQLQSNPSGITAQIESMYGNELGELLNSLENGGLAVKTAEIRGMPSESEKLLGVTLTLEPSR
jgi:hypothetical protein